VFVLLFAESRAGIMLVTMKERGWLLVAIFLQFGLDRYRTS
jgi:hypothetical protein